MASNIAIGEDAFREHLQSKGVIKPRPQKSDFLSYMITTAPSIKQYCNLGVKDSPERVSENNISYYRINFSKSPSLICQDSPSPEACLAISRNCLAYGRALFCDVAYIERLRRIAEATYFTRFRRIARVYEGITENMYENISPFVLRDIALYEKLLAENPIDYVTRGQNIQDIEHLFNCTNDQSSTRLVPFIAASILLGHEISHMAEFACPASKDINDLAQTLRDSYKTVTCQDIAWTEMLADVRSMHFIELPIMIAQSVDTGTVLLGSEALKQVCDKSILESLGISQRGAEVAKSHLKNENLALIIMTVANMIEYELSSFGGPTEALNAYETAISLHRKQATSSEINEYFMRHARKNLTAYKFKQIPHGLPALRGMGLLAGVDFPGFWSQCNKLNVENTLLVRLSSLMAGQIAQANILGCGATESQALNLGWSLVETMMSLAPETLNKNSTALYVKLINTRFTLRALPDQNLTEGAVALLVKRLDFFTNSWGSLKNVWDNPTGNGIKSKYELIADGKIVYDKSTNLMWQQSGSPTKLSQREMKSYITRLNKNRFGGYDNWRLPTLEEAISLIKPKHIDDSKSFGSLYINELFDNKQEYIYTSDLWTGYNIQRWYVYFNIGNVGHSHFSEDSVYAYVRAVRQHE